VIGKHEIQVATVDDYRTRCGINRIDILKSDTQGFDLEVLRGAERSMKSGLVRLVLVEVNFVRLYDGQAEYGELMSFLHRMGFRLSAFYQWRYRGARAAWADALFAHESCAD